LLLEFTARKSNQQTIPRQKRARAANCIRSLGVITRDLARLREEVNALRTAIALIDEDDDGRSVHKQEGGRGVA
jgi:hypothetical protein